MQVLAFPESFSKAEQLADLIRCPVAKVALHHFPDGESLVQLPQNLSEKVIVYQSLDRPNSKLIELLLLSEAARNQGVKYLTLVAPYLCYMRQDKAFLAGQAISQQIIGKFLAGLFNALITVDPHLHRVHNLQQAIPADQALALSASELIGQFIMTNNPQALLIGPDGESEQWVREVARPGDLDFVVAEKIRHGDTAVEITLPDYQYNNRDAILIDDIASSGHTLAAATKILFEKGVNAVSVLVTHALFMNDALGIIRAAGVDQIWSTDSVEHSSNVISLAPLIAEGITRLNQEEI